MVDARNALAHVVEMSGKPKSTISTDMGRSSNFVSALFVQKRAPGTDLMAEIARACGYRLQLVSDDGRDVVEIG